MTDEQPKSHGLTIVLVILLLVFFAFGGALLIQKNNKQKAIEKTMNQDFADNIKQFKASKSNVPVALISPANHILILNQSGEVVIYCEDRSNCVGKSKDEILKTLSELFTSMANLQRQHDADAKKFQPPVPPTPPSQVFQKDDHTFVKPPVKK
jgi:hypothetical protein